MNLVTYISGGWLVIYFVFQAERYLISFIEYFICSTTCKSYIKRKIIQTLYIDFL